MTLLPENKLLDFFRYFDYNNPDHVESIEYFEDLLRLEAPQALQEECRWVMTYRGEEHPANKPESGGGTGIPPESINKLDLNVIYFSQRDNASGQGYRECYSSSCAMAANYINGGTPRTDDEYNQVRAKYGDTTHASSQIAALKEYGIEARLNQRFTFEDIISHLRADIPVPAAILHKGNVNNPNGGGHWLVIKGYDFENEQFIVNDPFGELDLINGVYINTNGSNLRYSKKNFFKRYIVRGTDGGWAIDIES